MIKLIYEGVLTAGYYNDMEAGYPVFIDGESLSDIVKVLLDEHGLNSNFCFEPFGSAKDVGNPLVGKQVRLIMEIDDE